MASPSLLVSEERTRTFPMRHPGGVSLPPVQKPVAPMYKYISVLTPSKWYFLDINELKMYNNVKNIINLKEMLLWVLRA